MRKIPYFVAAVSISLASSPLVAGPPAFELPEQAYEVAKGKGVYYLGGVWKDGQLVEGYAFVHPRKAPPGKTNAKPDGVGGGNGGKGGGGGGGGDTTSTCFALLAKGARWKQAEPYLLDATNQDGLSETYIAEQLAASVLEWDKQVSTDIFGSQTSGVIDGADTSAPDDKNEIYFGDIAEPGVIAVTIVWGVFNGPAARRSLVEWDQVYNDPDFVWGNVDVDGSGVMDFGNIASHEVGHAAGMGHPDLSCTNETMHRYASEGETKKRDLNAGDISGVNSLY